jgi:hypothetical protein
MIMLGVRQLDLLLEALRRFSKFNDLNQSITEAWTGLGSYSTYKPCADAGLMEISTSPNPGYSTWWRLTEKGAMIVNAMRNMGYNHENVENGWGDRSIHKNGIMSITPHSFFANETTNRAKFDEEKGEFVF